MNLNSWKAYQDFNKVDYFPKRIGFPDGVKGPDVNRFNARVRLAKSFRGIDVDGYASDAVRGYNALFQVFLTHSTLEGFIKISGLSEPTKKAVKGLDSLSDLMVPYGSEKIVKSFFDRDKKGALYRFLHERVNNDLKERLRRCKSGESANVAYLSASIRHIFAHGDLSASSNGLRSPTLYPLCTSISTFLLGVMDGEFDKKIDACHGRIYAKRAQAAERGDADAGEQEPDTPRVLRDPLARVNRRAHLQAPHIAPLADYVRGLRLEAIEEEFVSATDRVPHLDPLDGGVEACCLFVFEAPGPKAVSSGFVSRDNDDDTAENFFNLTREAGLLRYKTVSWNIVPWVLESDGKNRNATKAEIEVGGPYLRRLLGMLPQLKVVVLSGGSVQQGERYVREYSVDTNRPVKIFKMAHPGRKVQNLHPGLYSKIP